MIIIVYSGGENESEGGRVNDATEGGRRARGGKGEEKGKKAGGKKGRKVFGMVGRELLMT